MNESFFQHPWYRWVHKHFKEALMSELSPFFLLQNFFLSHAVFRRVQKCITFDVTHHTKPECVGIYHAKGLQDWSTFKGDTRHLKKCTNFWTHCIYEEARYPRSAFFGGSTILREQLQHLSQLNATSIN